MSNKDRKETEEQSATNPNRGYFVLIPKGFENFVLVEVPNRVTRLEVRVDQLEDSIRNIEDGIDSLRDEFRGMNKKITGFLVTVIIMLLGLIADIVLRGMR